MLIGNREWSRAKIEAHCGHLHQVAGVRHYVCAEGRGRGVRVAEVQTGSGLCFTVVLDRGLDIVQCNFKGLGLVYLAPGGISHPAFHDPAGSEWLRSFCGGLLTTCGLTYLGPPGEDQGEALGLHGRYSSLPVESFCDRSRWEGDRYLIELAGVVHECVLGGDKLRLERSIRAEGGGRTVTVADTVTNVGNRPAPFTILYHVNAGFPLLDATSELILADLTVEPYDERAASHLSEIRRFQAPGQERLDCDFLVTMAADPEGYGLAGLVNRGLAGGLGLSLRFRLDTLPFLNVWKMMDERDYVVGIEPANTQVLDRGTLRRLKRLPFLQPGEQARTEVEFGVLEGTNEIGAFADRVNAARAGRLQR